MSPILPTSTDLPSARKDVQILARVLSGLENRRLTSSSQTIKAQVTEVSQNGNIVFSANNLRIAARISSQLPKTLRVGVPVILLLNSNNTDLAIKVIEPASKITPTAKNRFSSKKTHYLPRLHQGLVVEAILTRKSSTGRLISKNSRTLWSAHKHLPTLPNIFAAFPKQHENSRNKARVPELNIAKRASQFSPSLYSFSKIKNNNQDPNTSLSSTNNRPTKGIPAIETNYIKNSVSDKNTGDAKKNSSNLFLQSNTQTIPKTSARNVLHNSKDGVRHIVNITSSTGQVRKSFPLAFLQPNQIENTDEKNTKLGTLLSPKKKNEENTTNKKSWGTNNPMPNSLHQINSKSTGKYSTNNSGVKHAITSFLEQNQSRTNLIQYDGMDKTIGSGSKKVDVRIIKLLSPNSSSNTTKISNKDTVVTGTVIGKTLHGAVILDTPEQFMTLSGTTDLPRNAKIQIEQLPVRTKTNIAPEKLTIGQLTNGWARLETFVTDLNIKSPHNGINFTSNQIGKPNLKLTATMALFISAIRMGNPNLWLGHENRDIINRGQPGLIRGLDEDFFLMQRASEPSDSGWRAFFFPMLSDEQLSQIQLFIHQDKNSSGKDKNSSRKTRFIVNLKLDNIGELQIDGRVNSVIVDLLVQTTKPLPLKLKKGMRDVFKNTLDRTEIDGNIVFKVRKMLDPLPIKQLNGFSETLPSVTDI